MKRIAMVLSKKLTAGEVGNLAAILMGQVARDNEELFDEGGVADYDGYNHAAINTSTIVLKANGSGQLENLVKTTSTYDEVSTMCFSKYGQSINDDPATYQHGVNKASAGELQIVGVCLYGPYDQVRSLTKKFSLMT